MGSRRGGGPAITLFSFQDIITSVSGIIVFVTLILSVELAERVQRAGSNPAERDAFELENAIARAEAERDALRRRVLEQSVSSGHSSLRGEREAREAADQVARAEQELLRLDRRVDGARDRETAARVRKSSTEDEQQELRRRMAEADTLRERLRKERRGDRVYFHVEANQDTVRGGWLVLLDGRTVAAAPLDRPSRPRSFSGPPPDWGAEAPDPASRAFLDWAQHEAPRAYLLIVARPSGLRRVDPLQDELIRLGRRHGLDLVTERQEVLDPERGVYRP
jgi:hypothetical protein